MLGNKISDCQNLMQEVFDNERQLSSNINISKINDEFFFNLNIIINSLLSIKLIKNNFNFSFSEDSLIKLKSVASKCSKVLENKSLSYNECVILKAEIKDINSLLEKEWSSYTEEYYKSIIHKLEVIKIISSDKIKIESFIKNITKISVWPLEENIIKSFNNIFNLANKFLNDNKFDTDIEIFINKVAERKATLLDLNDEIIDWIKNQHLETKLLITVENIK